MSDTSALTGRVALVTGGGRGVGRATAPALARRGVAVAVLARTAAEVEATAAAVVAAGGRALAVPAGVEDVAGAVAATEAALGPVDILINNAAVVTPVAPLWRTEPAEWLACLTTNLYGPYLTARAVLPGMLARGWGRVVNVSSGAARGAVYGGGAYCSAKAGLDHLTRVLALELAGSGVTANVVYPGGVDTAMQARLREVSVADFGADNVAHFRRAKEEGQLLDPAVPAALIAWVVIKGGAEANGETFSINDAAVRLRARIGP